jgi:Flp pilus assembly protein TadD
MKNRKRRQPPEVSRADPPEADAGPLASMPWGPKKVAWYAALWAVIAALGFLTYTRCQVFRGPATLWADTLEKNDASALAHSQFAATRIAAKDLAAAETQLRRAIELDPDDAGYHTNLGHVLAMRGDPAAAEKEFTAALSLPHVNRAAIHFNLGAIYYRQQQLAPAESHLRESLSEQPSNSRAWNLLGAVLARRGATAEALACFRRSIVIDDNPEAHRAIQQLKKGSELFFNK